MWLKNNGIYSQTVKKETKQLIVLTDAPRGQTTKWTSFSSFLNHSLLHEVFSSFLPLTLSSLPSSLCPPNLEYSFPPPLSPVCIAQLPLVEDPALECGQPTRGHVIKESRLTFSQHYLIAIVPQLIMRFWTLPYPILGFSWVRAFANLLPAMAISVTS